MVGSCLSSSPSKSWKDERKTEMRPEKTGITNRKAMKESKIKVIESIKVSICKQHTGSVKIHHYLVSIPNKYKFL